MNNILIIIIGVLLTIELAMLMYCEYWRENNPWKWFSLKTITTLLIVFYLIHDVESFTKIDITFASIVAVCFGIDFTCTLIDSKKKF